MSDPVILTEDHTTKNGMIITAVDNKYRILKDVDAYEKFIDTHMFCFYIVKDTATIQTLTEYDILEYSTVGGETKLGVLVGHIPSPSPVGYGTFKFILRPI